MALIEIRSDMVVQTTEAFLLALAIFFLTARLTLFLATSVMFLYHWIQEKALRF